jgi:hypothetical protein
MNIRSNFKTQCVDIADSALMDHTLKPPKEKLQSKVSHCFSHIIGLCYCLQTKELRR